MTPADYASAAVQVLREHTTFITSEAVAEVIWDAVVRQASYPQDWFEVIADHPAQANWRLYPSDDDPRRVRLACLKQTWFPWNAGTVRAVNKALEALEARQ